MTVMRERRHEPGQGPTTSSHHGQHKPTVGKSTLVQTAFASAASEQSTAKAASSDPEADIELEIDLAKEAWEFVTDERRDALHELDRLLQQHDEPVPFNLLAELGKAALDLATDNLGGAVVQQVAGPVKDVIKEKVFDRTKNATHVRVQKTKDRAHAFVAMQLQALNGTKRDTAQGLDHVKHDLKVKLKKHPDMTDELIRRAKSVKQAFDARGVEAHQLQYNISLAKWFAALSQSSFGTPRGQKHVSDLGTNALSAEPLTNGDRNFDEYRGKQGFVHLELLVSPLSPTSVRVTNFATDGIGENVWNYRLGAGKALGQLALKDLPNGIHLPVIADVVIHLDPNDKEVKKHFPGGESGQTFQPIAISWNEKDAVTVELPTKANSDYNLEPDDRSFLARRFAETMKQPDHRAAARFLMQTKVGKHSLGLLKWLASKQGEIKD
jgi:hypothetical protein